VFFSPSFVDLCQWIIGLIVLVCVVWVWGAACRVEQIFCVGSRSGSFRILHSPIFIFLVFSAHFDSNSAEESIKNKKDSKDEKWLFV